MWGAMAAATTWTTMHFISSLGLFLFKLCKRSSNLNENHHFFVFEIFWGSTYWEHRCGKHLLIRQDRVRASQLLVPLPAIIWRALVETLLAQFQNDALTELHPNLLVSSLHLQGSSTHLLMFV
jgi:hypothetical protein